MVKIQRMSGHCKLISYLVLCNGFYSQACPRKLECLTDLTDFSCPTHFTDGSQIYPFILMRGVQCHSNRPLYHITVGLSVCLWCRPCVDCVVCFCVYLVVLSLGYSIYIWFVIPCCCL